MDKKLTGGQYLTMRLLLWAIAVSIALLPAAFGIPEWEGITDAEAFKDVLFVVVPVSALALSTTVDYVCVGFPDEISASAFFYAMLSGVLNGLGLVAGLVGFVSIREEVLPLFAFWTYSTLICVAVVASLVTEIVISRNHHVFKTRWQERERARAAAVPQ